MDYISFFEFISQDKLKMVSINYKETISNTLNVKLLGKSNIL